jgi:hypothetical protein
VRVPRAPGEKNNRKKAGRRRRAADPLHLRTAGLNPESEKKKGKRYDVPGTAATWVAPAGAPATRAPGRGAAAAPSADAWVLCARGAREGRVRDFLGGALRCLADSEARPKKKTLKQILVIWKLNTPSEHH